MLGDVFGSPVYVLDSSQSAAVGAALRAMSVAHNRPWEHLSTSLSSQARLAASPDLEHTKVPFLLSSPHMPHNSAQIIIDLHGNGQAIRISRVESEQQMNVINSIEAVA